MSLQMFIKIDGVEGGSKSYKYKGWSDVYSWNWGMTSNRKSSQKVDADKTSFNELSIIKPIGIDSTDIRMLYARGSDIANVELSIIPVVAKREPQTKYVHINLEDVVIKSIVTGGGVEDNYFKEHITFLFDRINFEYSDSEGTGDAANDNNNREHNFSWDVPANTDWNH